MFNIVKGILNIQARVPHPPAISVLLSNHRVGRICVTEVCERNSWEDLTALNTRSTLPGGYKTGDLVKCIVLENSDLVELSLRPSRLVWDDSIFKPIWQYVNTNI